MDNGLMRSVIETYQQKLDEAASSAAELVADIESTFKKHFPNSFINARHSKGIGNSIMVTIALAKDKMEAPNKIIDNDPMLANFAIHMNSNQIDDSGEFTGEPLVIERFRGAGLSWHGQDGFNRIKVPFRKTTGDPAKIIKALDRHFQRLSDAVKENAEALNAKHDFDVTKKVR